jgi:DNA-binding winged helix-turn-helix (wHTH) protein/TolB-like protein
MRPEPEKSIRPRRLFAIGPFRLDPADRLLSRDGQPVALTPKALETLVVLVERHGKLVTKEELFQRVWPDAFVEENNLAQHISTLRRVLGEGLPDNPLIETVPRRGYRFVGRVVEEVEDDPTPASALEPPSCSAAITGGGTTGTVAEWPMRSAALWGLVAVVPLTLLVLTAWRPGNAMGPGEALAAKAAGFARSTPAHLARVAVLPFQNLGPAADDYFAAGMTEEITSRLASLSRVAVPSSSTVTAYDRTGKNLKRIAADLGVDYVVEGSARWVPGSSTRVRITPKLIRAADDTTVWTQAYETALADLTATQAEIAFQIAGALQVSIESGERKSIQARPSSNSDAYLAYLRGIAAIQQGPWDTARQAMARENLEEAVAQDPRFAPA